MQQYNIAGSTGCQPAGSQAAGSRALEPEAATLLADTRRLEVGDTAGAEVYAAQDWLIWQLADSAFPSGGFAHSGGLEAAAQQGEIHDAGELEAFIKGSLYQFAHTSLLFMIATFDEPETWAKVDQLCDCFTTNHVANRASRLQGRAFLASIGHVFPELHRQDRWAADLTVAGHLAPVFGATLRELSLERTTAARLFLFSHLRGLVSAAVRLGLVGPLQGQSMQRRMAAEAEDVFGKCQGLTLDEIAQTAPLLDLWQANQDCLYSRLFQS